jgi:SAM-dependent methyltransferase
MMRYGALAPRTRAGFVFGLTEFDLEGHMVTAILLLSIASWTASSGAVQQTSSQTAAPSPEQQQTYLAFRAWLSSQPREVQEADDEVVYKRYGEELRRQGKSEQDITATLASLKLVGDRAEIEFWNKVLTAPQPRFNTSPNAFLVAMTKGMKPGRSLDVGMGQGRNTIYLAQQGWDSVGFDPAERAVAAAQEQAAKLGVKITTHIARDKEFDWGTAQWDLIVLSYIGARDYVPTVVRALRPGGMVVVEGFHRDVLKIRPVGGAVVFDTNELLTLFAPLRIVRYEDTQAVADFGQAETRVVRLAAVKPQ